MRISKYQKYYDYDYALNGYFNNLNYFFYLKIVITGKQAQSHDQNYNIMIV